MSAGPTGGREVAYRLFAAEYNDAEYSYSESDEERAPNYVITPTGARANRVFVVGVLTEVEQVGDDILRGRVVDPTGAFVLYAGQYQPDEQAFLEAATPPTFVAVTGKARTFEPEDSDQVFTSIRPESINEVDADTRDRWTVQAAKRTLERIGQMATACSLSERGEELEARLRSQGMSERDAQGVALALDYYGTTPTYLDALRDVALDAAGVVAGETDEVAGLSASPDEQGTVTAEAVLDSLPTFSMDDEGTTADEPDASHSPEPDELMTGTGQAPVAEASTTDTADTGTGETTDSGTGDTPDTGTTDTGTDETTTSADPSERADPEPATASTETPEPSDTVDDTPPDPTETEEASTSESPPATGEDDLDDFEPGEFDIPEEEREQVKKEYGTEFQTGTEVDEPGEADIETPEPPAEEAEPQAEEAEPEEPTQEETESTQAAESADSEPQTETEPVVDSASQTEKTDDGNEDSPDGATDEELEDVQATVIEVMRELDDGTGADRDELIAEMNSRYGLDAETVEDAIDDALMAGQCYEPDDSTVTPI